MVLVAACIFGCAVDHSQLAGPPPSPDTNVTRLVALEPATETVSSAMPRADEPRVTARCTVGGMPAAACDTEVQAQGPAVGQGCTSPRAMLDRRRPRLERCFLSAWRSKRPPDAPQPFDLRFDPHWQLEGATAVGDTYGAAASCMVAELAGLAAQAEAPPPPSFAPRLAVGWSTTPGSSP